jgi:hypothetical protein
MMRLFNNNPRKLGVLPQLNEPLANQDLEERQSSCGLVSMKTSSSQVNPELVLDWSKIYVEIDNDANAGTNLSKSKSFQVNGTTTTGTEASRSDDDESRATTDQISVANSANTGDASGETDGAQTTEYYQDEGPRRFLKNLGSYPTAVSSKDDSQGAFTITNNGKYLTTNDFANGQLMRWKFSAEEGPAYIQILAFMAALAAFGSTLYPLVMQDSYWTIPLIICAFHTIVLCLIILIFELRALGARNPMNVRARARTLLTRYLNILRLLWGRGCLYVFTGTMNIAIYHTYTLYTGLTLVVVGFLAILIGAHSSFNLERLKLSLTDHSYLWSKFEAADSDRDNLIDICEFSNLIWSLGLELDDAYTYRAFSQIDKDADAKINFEDFRNWWIVVQDERPLPDNINV